ncbi:MAG: hypothetical protein ACXVUE_01415 [Solirubrobacteraceae bacterium]
MSDVKLNWSTAKVEDSKLTVDLDGELPSGWKDSFDAVARLLASSADWGEVKLKGKKSVLVSDVSKGSEERLRHFLESVVEQSNADHRPDESGRDDADESDDADEDEGGDDQDEAGPDDQMSERFRSFAD